MLLPGKGIAWKDFFRELKNEWSHDRIGDTAGALTYAGILAIFPFLLFALAVAGLVIDPKDAESLIAQLGKVAPPQVTQILSDQIRSLAAGGSPGLLTIGALGAIWAASGGVRALMTALNVVYDVEEGRPWWKTIGLSILITLGGAVLVVLAVAIALVTPVIAHFIGGPIATLILWLRIPVAALLMMLILALLYYFLPDVEQDFKFITPGSVFAVVVWALASLGFSVYVNNFGSYEATYGALGGVIVFLLWMWISSVVILLGAEINAIIEHMSPEGKRTGAKSMADTGADVPKTQKEETRAKEPAMTPTYTGIPTPNGRPGAPAAAFAKPAIVQPAAQLKPVPPPPPRRPSPLVDGVVGLGALIAGFFLTRRAKK